MFCFVLFVLFVPESISLFLLESDFPSKAGIGTSLGPVAGRGLGCVSFLFLRAPGQPVRDKGQGEAALGSLLVAGSLDGRDPLEKMRD